MRVNTKIVKHGCILASHFSIRFYRNQNLGEFLRGAAKECKRGKIRITPINFQWPKGDNSFEKKPVRGKERDDNIDEKGDLSNQV